MARSAARWAEVAHALTVLVLVLLVSGFAALVEALPPPAEVSPKIWPSTNASVLRSTPMKVAPTDCGTDRILEELGRGVARA